MPTHALRQFRPAPGDVPEVGGRHRRADAGAASRSAEADATGRGVGTGVTGRRAETDTTGHRADTSAGPRFDTSAGRRAETDTAGRRAEAGAGRRAETDTAGRRAEAGAGRRRAGTSTGRAPETGAGGHWAAAPGSRAARHQRAAFVDDGPAGRIVTGGGAGRRRASAHRPPAPRRPATGSHRAPGTLPIESWLLMGKKRQQVLLASLVAIGVLLVALPGQHRPDRLDPVQAAQQGEAGNRGGARHDGRPGDDAGPGDNQNGGGRDDASPGPTAAPTGGASQRGRPDPGRLGSKAGPGRSLRTTGSSVVALTFDDGPDPVQTPRLLALLDEYDVRATFCLVGEQVRRHPELVRQIVTAGHTVCNHTSTHSLTIGKDESDEIRADLARTNAAIQAAAPGVSVPFFRAPGGNFTERLVSVAAESQMTSLYWAVDPRDWDHPEGESDTEHVNRVVAEVKRHVRPGSIVLSHDFNQPDTVAAYERLLPWLTERFTLGVPGQGVPSRTPSTPDEPPAGPEPSAPATPVPTEEAAHREPSAA
jgi:peptidoglycan-N-acetylglucosamine deacetylase